MPYCVVCSADTTLTVQLAAACLGMGDPSSEYRPPITFVVVQKRHHTRLFPAKPNEGDRSGNILPGESFFTASYHCTTLLAPTLQMIKEYLASFVQLARLQDKSMLCSSVCSQMLFSLVDEVSRSSLVKVKGRVLCPERFLSSCFLVCYQQGLLSPHVASLIAHAQLNCCCVMSGSRSVSLQQIVSVKSA